MTELDQQNRLIQQLNLQDILSSCSFWSLVDFKSRINTSIFARPTVCGIFLISPTRRAIFARPLPLIS
jgi:hypothetical protein